VMVAKTFSFKRFRLMSFTAQETTDVDVATHFST
jgi:hypothetical protein